MTHRFLRSAAGAACFALASLALAGTAPVAAQALQERGQVRAPAVHAIVSVADQKMYLYIGNEPAPSYIWMVSTVGPNVQGCTESGLQGGKPVPCQTPIGRFSPTSVLEKSYVKKWHSWMYDPVYIDMLGDAIHGTDEEADLGKPASHGCVRITKENAKLFHDLVMAHEHGKVYPGVTIDIMQEHFTPKTPAPLPTIVQTTLKI